MTDRLAPPPKLTSVFRAQLLLVGMGLRGEALMLGGLLLLLSILMPNGEAPNRTLDFFPPTVFLAVAGLAMPWSVWRRDPMFGASWFSALPVDGRLHVLVRVLAGGVWALASMLLVVMWVTAAITVATGSFPFDGLQPSVPAPGPDPALQALPLWSALSPFIALTVTYLLGSAAYVGLRRPLLGLFGAAFLVFLVLTFAPEQLVEGLQSWLWHGPVGLDYLFTGGVDRYHADVAGFDGSATAAAAAPPLSGSWAMAVSSWLGISIVAFACALLRRREL